MLFQMPKDVDAQRRGYGHFAAKLEQFSGSFVLVQQTFPVCRMSQVLTSLRHSKHFKTRNTSAILCDSVLSHCKRQVVTRIKFPLMKNCTMVAKEGKGQCSRAVGEWQYFPMNKNMLLLMPLGSYTPLALLQSIN